MDKYDTSFFMYIRLAVNLTCALLEQDVPNSVMSKTEMNSFIKNNFIVTPQSNDYERLAPNT